VEEEGRDVTICQRTRTGAASTVALLVAACLASTSIAPNLFADDDLAKKKALATDLFDKGVKKMEQGHCDETPIADAATCKEARESFKAAYEIYPDALGALRNLAYVEKGLGLVASASRSFRELARKAPLDPKPERRLWADYAKKEVEALEVRIPHLVVKMPNDRPTGTKLTIDGVVMEEAVWATQIDVDPGKHEIKAEAPGRLKFIGSVTLAEKQTKTIGVILDLDKNPGPVGGTEGGSRTMPLVVAGVGVVGVGVGLTFGYLSMKKRDDACGGTKICDPKGLDDGKSLANVSTIVTSVGAAALVGGLVWFLLTPAPSGKTEDRAATIAPYANKDGAGLSAFGRF
jgi:hypothetical protein